MKIGPMLRVGLTVLALLTVSQVAHAESEDSWGEHFEHHWGRPAPAPFLAAGIPAFGALGAGIALRGFWRKRKQG